MAKNCNCPNLNGLKEISSIKKNYDKINISSNGSNASKSEVGEDILRRRRNKCRYCEFATKDADKKESNGLTTSSICLKNDKNIAEFTSKKKSSCPLNYWD
jgi:hypothetical protein